MPTLPNGLTRDQLALALHRLNPAHTYRVLSDTEYEYRGPDATPPSDAALIAAWSAFVTEQSAATTDEQTRRSAVQSQVQTLVGIDFRTMTAAQRQLLIAALAYKLGALDKTLAVRPLGEWL